MKVSGALCHDIIGFKKLPLSAWVEGVAGEDLAATVPEAGLSRTKVSKSNLTRQMAELAGQIL